jgi:hypothetical protein
MQFLAHSRYVQPRCHCYTRRLHCHKPKISPDTPNLSQSAKVPYQRASRKIVPADRCSRSLSLPIGRRIPPGTPLLAAGLLLRGTRFLQTATIIVSNESRIGKVALTLNALKRIHSQGSAAKDESPTFQPLLPRGFPSCQPRTYPNFACTTRHNGNNILQRPRHGSSRQSLAASLHLCS